MSGALEVPVGVPSPVVSVLDDDTKAKILRQVEFYFSDSNLPGDKFLLKCIEEAEDGLVSLPLVCSFARMRSHLGQKEHGPENVNSEKITAVVEVLRQSTSLRLSEDGLKVGRVSKLKVPEEVQAEVNARSIAASPLPWKIEIDEVEKFFKQHGKVNSVRLPRLVGTKAFSGYATVEFVSEEEAERVMGLKLVFHGAELDLEPKKAFDERQAATPPNTNRNGQVRDSGPRGRTVEDDGYPKGVLVSIKLKKVLGDGEDRITQTTSGGAEGSSVHVTESKTDVDPKEDMTPTEQQVSKIQVEQEESKTGLDQQDNKTEVDQQESKMETEAVLKPEEIKMTKDQQENTTEMDIDPATQVAREDIKDTLAKFGNIKYVDFQRGDDSGYVRFEEAAAAQRARAHAVMAQEGGFIIKGYLITLDPVEGEAEKEYWNKLREGRGKKREGGRGFNDRGRGFFDNGRGRGGRFGRGRGGGRGRRGDRNEESTSNGGMRGKHKRFNDGDEDERPNKAVRTDG